MKRLTLVILMVIIALNSACSNMNGGSGKKKNAAMEMVKQMGTGWNLGNTLDSYDGKKYNLEAMSQKKYSYQIMANYQTQAYSGWDASETPYFDKHGQVTLNWNITTLNSKLDGNCGKFAIQIINHDIENSSDLLGIQVTKAQFKTASGTVITLDQMIGNTFLTFTDGVTIFIEEDLTNQEELKTTNDLLGGTLTVEAQITQYIETEVKEDQVSPVEYYETLWGNPVTTQEMIAKVKEAGFQSVRVPVSYYDHMDENDEIDSEWLKRVSEVVQYVTEQNMYCIINLHHESDWLQADANAIDSIKERLRSVWEQIATYFKDYTDHLIFEGFNEVLNAQSQWTDAGSDSYQALNELNQTFVDTVRNSGGKNDSRFLIVNTYAAAGAQDVIDEFKLPKDTIQNHLMVEIHYYGTLDKMDSVFKRLNESFVNKGIPVIIGEFAPFNNSSKEEMIEYVQQFYKEAKKNQYLVFWWDRGGAYETTDAETETLLNRRELTWYNEELLQTIFKSLK